MARRSRYLHYDKQMTALMKRGNLSQIPADRNHTRGSVIEKLKMLGAAEPVRGKLILQLLQIQNSGRINFLAQRIFTESCSNTWKTGLLLQVRETKRCSSL